jgi:hypothetical protein
LTPFVGEKKEVIPVDKETKFVTVDKIAQAFGISERAAQKLVIYNGMPRKDRGSYDLEAAAGRYLAGKIAQVGSREVACFMAQEKSEM